MSEGAFQTDRAIFENKIWKQPLKFRLFFYIYGNAVFSEYGVNIGDVHIERGQYLRSYRGLQNDLEYLENHAVKQYSLSQIKKAIDELVSEKRLSIVNLSLGTLFTVLNYEEYQGFDRYKNQSIERRKNRERTEKERNQNNNNKDNNDKNDNKDIYSMGTSPMRKQFIIPSLEEVKTYCKERNNNVDAERWHDYYSSNGWRVGKNPMRDWKASIRNWEKESFKSQLVSNSKNTPRYMNFDQRKYDKDYFEKIYKAYDQ